MLGRICNATKLIIRSPDVYGSCLANLNIYFGLIYNKSQKTGLIKRTYLGVTLFFFCLSVTTAAVAETGSFTVHFAGCTEFAGWGPVSLAEAQPLVPAGYVIAGAAMGQAAIVVRATSCLGVAVGQSPAQPTELSQIGINLVAPDGTGDINNYTVIYVTNNQALAEHFRLPAFPRFSILSWPTNTRLVRWKPQVNFTWRPPVRDCQPIFFSEPRTSRRPIHNKAFWRTGGSPAMAAR
jgi:hypothetical protein